jgi:hypothetical protein
MSAGKITNLRAALFKGFNDAAFFTAAKVGWENMPFDPPKDEPWAQIFFVPNQPSVATLGSDGEDETDGFVQINLNYPQGNGTQAIEAKFDAIRNVFTAGARFSYSGDVAVIRSCGRSQGRVVNGSYQIVVTIMFYAHINRS